MSSLEIVDQIADTPIPPAAFGSALLLKGLTSTRPIDTIAGSSGSSAKFARSLAIAQPTRASCWTFGLTNLVGAYMIYDHDLQNGAGFTFAWSTLYLIVNGRSSIKSVFSGRVSPLGLSLLALGNATIYGKKFFWPLSKLA